MTGSEDERRAAFRAFVREHHPDRGGDPEVFRAGLARFGTGEPAPAEPPPAEPPLPFPVRVAVAALRTWRWHRQRRVG